MTSVSSTHVVLAYPLIQIFPSISRDSRSPIPPPERGSQGISLFANHLHDDEGRLVSIQNMTVSTNYSAKANATALVIQRHQHHRDG